MTRLLFAALVAMALIVLPGYGLTRLLAPYAGRLKALAVAPAVSAGMAYVVGEVMTRASLPIDVRLGIVVLVVGLITSTLGEFRSGARWTLRPIHAAALAGVVLGAATWLVGMGHLSAVPPHDDGYNHGYFTQRIVATASLDPARVLAHDAVSAAQGAVSFYPLALHEQAALVVRLAGVDAAAAFTAVSLLTIVLALPIGVALLTKRLFPSHRFAPAFAAILAAALPALPYLTTQWGGYPMAAGIAVVGGIVDVGVDAVVSRNVRLGVITALGLAGIAGIHTSELPLALLLIAALSFEELYQTVRLRAVAPSAGRVAAIGLVCAALLLPVIGQMRAGAAERTGIFAKRSLVGLGGAVNDLTVFVPTILLMIASVAVIVALRRRLAIAWPILWLLFVALFIWLSMSTAVVTTLTSPWYSDPNRLGYIIGYLSLPLLGWALGVPVAATARVFVGRDRTQRRLRPAVLVSVVGAASAVLVTVGSASASASTVRENYAWYSIVDGNTRQAYAYLAAHVGSNARVLDQLSDAGPWMYALDGVAPLLPINSSDFTGQRAADYSYLVSHITAVCTDPRVRQLLSTYDVSFVFVGDTTFHGERPSMTAHELHGAAGLREVFDRGRAHVFQVVGPTGCAA